VINSEFTARDLFNSTYAKRITDDFNSGKLEPDKFNETTVTLSSDSKWLFMWHVNMEMLYEYKTVENIGCWIHLFHRMKHK